VLNRRSASAICACARRRSWTRSSAASRSPSLATAIGSGSSYPYGAGARSSRAESSSPLRARVWWTPIGSILQRTESEFDPLPFDAPAARIYGQRSGAVLAYGRTPRRRHADLQIAATAVANGLPLYTADPDDYAGLHEWLTVVPVPRPPQRP
jgi:predicted nucleic acid-binding protein